MTIISYKYNLGIKEKMAIGPIDESENRKLVFWCTIVIFLFFLCCGIYIFSVTKTIGFKYEIEKVKTRLQSLEVENENLRAELANIKSIKNLEEFAKLHGLQPENQPIYLRTIEKVAKQ